MRTVNRSEYFEFMKAINLMECETKETHLQNVSIMQFFDSSKLLRAQAIYIKPAPNVAVQKTYQIEN